MEFADIIPGHENDDDLIRGNYRPVSVLPIYIMNKQMFSYFVD